MIITNPFTGMVINANPEGCNQYTGPECGPKGPKIEKFRSHAKYLSKRFGLSEPIVEFGDAGSSADVTGRTAPNRGVYHRAKKGVELRYFNPKTKERRVEVKDLPAKIILRPNMPLETLVHEIAHHAAEEHDMKHRDPEQFHDLNFEFLLSALRREVGGKEFEHLALEGPPLKKLPKAWQ